MKKWFILLLLLSVSIHAQQLIDKVIPLNYAQPNELLPALNAVLQPDESIRVYKNSFIVSVSPETLTKLRNLIHQLDVAPAVFLVAIHQGKADWLDDQDDSIHYSTTNGQSQADNQSVQVENGASAFVSMGSDYPVISQVDVGWATGVGYQRMNAQKGFLIHPELQGNKVKVSIKRTYDQENPVNQNNQQEQQAATTTIIPFNKWVNISQAGGDDYKMSNTNHYTAGKSFETNTALFIKITLVNN